MKTWFPKFGFSNSQLVPLPYVNSILSTLPGVDPNDPSIQAALNPPKEEDKEGDK